MVATTLVTAAPSSVPARPKVEATTAADTEASAPASTCTTLNGIVLLAWSGIVPRACPNSPLPADRLPFRRQLPGPPARRAARRHCCAPRGRQAPGRAPALLPLLSPVPRDPRR